MRKIARIFALALGLASLAAPALAQTTCPVIPALPDTTRRTEYSISSSTGPLNVGFQLYGDSTDYGAWLSVWVNGVLKTAVTDYTVTSPSGSLGSLCRPITDAQVTFTVAQTGTIEIEGGRRPRRAAQVSENRGVTAHDFNQIITDLTAQLRERWDREGRLLRTPPGDSLTVLPLAAARAGGYLTFDGLGNPLILAAGSSLPISPQNANRIFAGPATGGPTAPTFRALVNADLPFALPLIVSNGGTNCAAASATCLDNITGFSSTGVVRRTGAGAYSFLPGTMAALDIADQTLSGGANVTSLAQPTGNISIDCGARPIQTITNGGAYTITAPSNDGFCLLKVTNNASAGATTFSGFSVGSNTGDPLTTTNTQKFIISIIRAGGDSTYSIKALQ